MKNWLNELATNKQPLKRIGGLTFKLNWRVKMTNHEKMKKAFELTMPTGVKSMDDNQVSIGDCLYHCGIEKEDTSSIMRFLAARIEDQYYESAPDEKTQTFIDQLKSMSKDIEEFIII